MKNRPIHENLDTSFVNLSALIKYLRRRQFVGSIRIELSGYEAEVDLTADNQLLAREHDRIAGRIAEGEEALQRLLIRAREPGGVINVYQAVEENAPSFEESELKGEEQIIAAETEQAVVEVLARQPHKNGNSKTENIKTPIAENGNSASAQNISEFPFDFSNNFEAKAKQTNSTPQDWQTLINLTAELLRTIDESLAEANLDFTAAFEKARSEIAGDYPFLNPSANVFDYRDGKITMRERTGAKLFAVGINEALRRIIEKLGKNPKFGNIYRIITKDIRLLIEQRRPLYDKFFITPPLEKIIGG